MQYVTGNLCRGERCDVDFKTIGCYKDKVYTLHVNACYKAICAFLV